MKQNTAILILATIVIVIALGFLAEKLFKTMIYPVKGKVTSGFGDRIHPITGVKKFHNGIDISAPTGTNVVAPGDGKITGTNYHSSGGNQMFMKLDNGYSAGFAHLDSYVAKVGTRVKKGEVIARVGNTGASTGPHLHLTMRDKASNYVDPVTVLKA